MLNALAHAGSPRSVVVVAGAKWTAVEIRGWRHDVTSRRGAIVLREPDDHPEEPGLKQVGMRFMNPEPSGGGLDLEIHLSERSIVFGNGDVLVVASANEGMNRAITIQAVAGATPGIDQCFKLTDDVEAGGERRVDLEPQERELLQTCSQALGAPVRVVDLEFDDGTRATDIKLAGDAMMVPEQYAGKAIKSVLIPLEQGPGPRSGGHAAKFGRSDKQLVLGTTVMLWLMKQR
jgi:hypothetical protein